MFSKNRITSILVPKALILLFGALCLCPAARAQQPDTVLVCPEVEADTLAVAPVDTAPRVPEQLVWGDEPRKRSESPDWWLNRIKANTYNIKDTTVIYPRFLGFCAKVYNWGDTFFNTYDPDYVVGTGTKWKAMVKLSNWTDSYSMTLGKTHIRMLSNVYSTVGPYVSFMAVSVGYDANLNRLISHLPARQKRWEFNFSTSLFWLNVYYTTNKDGTVIRDFGDYRDAKGKRWISQPFPDLQLRNYGLELYYFVNHKRYSQGAAYNFSKIQKRSQGSVLVGVSLSHQYIDMDFSSLPGAMLAFFPWKQLLHYNFTYNDFCILVGYAHNQVFGRHWLWNITALPTVGIKHVMPPSTDRRRDLFSLNGKASTSLVLNLNHVFAGIFSTIDLHWYNSSRISFANAVFTFGAHAGYRF